MPIYSFIGPGGETLELLSTVDDRDRVCPPGFRRVTVPERLNVCFSDALPTQSETVHRGLYDLENRIGTSEMERQVGWSSKQLKRIWREDTP